MNILFNGLSLAPRALAADFDTYFFHQL